jgi:hypothetical protein
MKKLFLILFSHFVIVISAQAQTVSDLAKELNLQAGSKASIQWERVFSSPRHIKRYKLQHLSSLQLLRLKTYLIKHAADSEQPIVPGL